jgi:hypothetical protein
MGKTPLTDAGATVNPLVRIFNQIIEMAVWYHPIRQT